MEKQDKREDFPEFECMDCDTNTHLIDEYYMVQFDLWYSVAEKGMLCIGCLESRIGRKLTPSDFIDCAVNDGIFGLSDRLKDRLGFPKDYNLYA
jgi:hypothetical protein